MLIPWAIDLVEQRASHIGGVGRRVIGAKAIIFIEVETPHAGENDATLPKAFDQLRIDRQRRTPCGQPQYGTWVSNQMFDQEVMHIGRGGCGIGPNDDFQHARS